MILAAVFVAVPSLIVSEPGTVLSTCTISTLMMTASVMMMTMLMLLSSDDGDDCGDHW